MQSQSLSAQQHIIPVDQLANVTGSQNASVNDLENVSAPAQQNEIDQQNDVSAQASADIETKDELPTIQSEQNSINDNHTSKYCSLLFTVCNDLHMNKAHIPTHATGNND